MKMNWNGVADELSLFHCVYSLQWNCVNKNVCQ